MLDMVYVAPPAKDVYGHLKGITGIFPPINLVLLATRDRQKGMNVAILDCPAEGLDCEQAALKLVSMKPLSVGITAMTQNIFNANKLAGMIKDLDDNIVLILGGKHVMSVPEETRRTMKNFDIYHTADDFTRYMPTLPLPTWELLDGFPNRYRPHLFYGSRTPWSPLLTSVGCNGKCIFCYSGNHHEICKTFSSEYIFSMITELVKKYKIREITILDDNFVMYRQTLHELCDKLINAHYDLVWTCNARVDKVNYEMLKEMSLAGCKYIAYGIESSSQKQLDALNKGVTLDQMAHAIDMTHNVGMRAGGSFMMGKFGETKKSIMDLSRFAKHLKLDEFRLTYFTPMPGTKSWTMWKKYGKMDTSWDRLDFYQPAFIGKGLTKKWLEKTHDILLRDFYLRPSIIWGYMKILKNPITILRIAVAFGRYITYKVRHGR